MPPDWSREDFRLHRTKGIGSSGSAPRSNGMKPLHLRRGFIPRKG